MPDTTPALDMDPEVAAAMRERRADGMWRWNAIVPQCKPFFEKAISRPPDPETRNQHFISQFWLRAFAADSDKHLIQMDINVDPNSPAFARRVSVRQAAAGEHLFTLKQDIGSVGSHHEERMELFEDAAAPLFKQMAASYSPPDADYERWLIAHYLTFVLVQAPSTMKLSCDMAVGRIEKLIGELADQGVEFTKDFLDSLPQRYALSGTLGNSQMINKIAFLFFSRNWRVVKMPVDMPLALPLFPIVHWGQGLLQASEIWVPVSPDALLCMSWLELPADDDLYTGDVCNQALGLLIRHVQEASGGQMFVHPDHREWWGQRVEERRAEA